jgi:phosphoribosylformylglycinamidine synthase
MADGRFLIMLSQKYAELNQTIFTIDIAPEAILDIDDIAAYNKQEGLSLSRRSGILR